MEIPVDLWKKLETLYLSKSLTNKIYLKEKFNKMCMDLANTTEKFYDENQTIILLNALGKL